VELRLYEQLAIHLFKPTLNATKSISVLTQFSTDDLSLSLKLANQLISLFPPNHELYYRFSEMLEDLKQTQSAYDLIKSLESPNDQRSSFS